MSMSGVDVSSCCLLCVACRVERPSSLLVDCVLSSFLDGVELGFVPPL